VGDLETSALVTIFTITDAVVEHNEAADGGKQTSRQITKSNGPINASIKNNRSVGKGSEQENTVIDGETYHKDEQAKLQFELDRLKAEIRKAELNAQIQEAQLRLASINVGTQGL